MDKKLTKISSEHDEIRFSDIFKKNAVLTYALGVTPVAALSSTLQTALAISLVYAVVIFATYLFASIKIPVLKFSYLRIPVYALVASLAFIPAMMLAKLVFPTVEDMLGHYVYLVVMDVIVIYRAETFANKQGFLKATKDATINVLGLTLIAVIVGSVRELLGRGAIFGMALFPKVEARAVSYPLFGFILLGFLIAFQDYLRYRTENPVPKEKQKGRMKHKTKDQEIEGLLEEKKGTKKPKHVKQAKSPALPAGEASVYEIPEAARQTSEKKQESVKRVRSANQLKPSFKPKEEMTVVLDEEALEKEKERARAHVEAQAEKVAIEEEAEKSMKQETPVGTKEEEEEIAREVLKAKEIALQALMGEEGSVDSGAHEATKEADVSAVSKTEKSKKVEPKKESLGEIEEEDTRPEIQKKKENPKNAEAEALTAEIASDDEINIADKVKSSDKTIAPNEEVELEENNAEETTEKADVSDDKHKKAAPNKKETAAENDSLENEINQLSKDDLLEGDSPEDDAPQDEKLGEVVEKEESTAIESGKEKTSSKKKVGFVFQIENVKDITDLDDNNEE